MLRKQDSSILKISYIRHLKRKTDAFLKSICYKFYWAQRGHP